MDKFHARGHPPERVRGGTQTGSERAAEIEAKVKWAFFFFTLKELRHDILGCFFDGLNGGLSAGKPNNNTVEALVSGHPRDAKKVSVTAAGRLREWFRIVSGHH